MRTNMEITNVSSLLSFFILAMAFILSALATNITTDQSSLLSLKSYTSLSHNHTLANNWSITASICNWIGVVCGSKHHRVVELNISSMGIVGTLPPQLGNLSFLVSLNISHNSFYGNLPRELASLGRLQYIDFGYNNFSGKIPEEIGNLENAKWLILEVNQLDGPIPFTIFNISTLQNLVLNDNSLSSSLPMKLCQHGTRLKVLHLYSNKLSGDISKNLSSCSELEDLRLNYNNFVGTIPKEIGSLNMLRILKLNSNNLEGTPETIFNISTLTFINMANNHLFGILPSNMCSHLQKLEVLYLYTNKLYGNIPRSIVECSMLTSLQLSENSLLGEIPREIGNLNMLEDLILDRNNLEGEIPKEIKNLNMLQMLILHSNNLKELLEKASRSKKHYDTTIEGLQCLLKKLDALKIDDDMTSSTGCLTSMISHQDDDNNNVAMRDPPRVTTKGRPRSIRMKGALELKSNGVTCSTCKKKGHTKRTCTLKNKHMNLIADGQQLPIETNEKN